MRTKLIRQVYDWECHLFQIVNKHFDFKPLNTFFVRLHISVVQLQ